ncbi:MoaD/ThiS family protein [Bacteriovoracaceae bacterium]|nr:MoaD/ThiS family protein [Bacteriovoracaceae bacterium]
MKTINVTYFAILREERGLKNESLETSVVNGKELYEELSSKYNFSLNAEILRIAINGSFESLDTPLNERDEIAFIPPVAGG